MKHFKCTHVLPAEQCAADSGSPRPGTPSPIHALAWEMYAQGRHDVADMDGAYTDAQ